MNITITLGKTLANSTLFARFIDATGTTLETTTEGFINLGSGNYLFSTTPPSNAVAVAFGEVVGETDVIYCSTTIDVDLDIAQNEVINTIDQNIKDIEAKFDPIEAPVFVVPQPSQISLIVGYMPEPTNTKSIFVTALSAPLDYYGVLKTDYTITAQNNVISGEFVRGGRYAISTEYYSKTFFAPTDGDSFLLPAVW